MRIPTSVLRTTLLEDAARFAFAAPVDEIDACARRAFSANGFGDAVVVEQRPPSGAPGANAPGSRLSAALRSLRDFAARHYAAWRRQGRARDTLRALDELDSRTLRDLGFDRSELPSIAVELAAAIHHSRVQAIRAAARV
jgi:uncharacterized protein YjiS (DUF1127 family)